MANAWIGFFGGFAFGMGLFGAVLAAAALWLAWQRRRQNGGGDVDR